jgi:uncharacterized membrane protein (UPF0127 family)
MESKIKSMDIEPETVRRVWKRSRWWFVVAFTLLLGVGGLLAVISRPSGRIPISVFIGGQPYTLEVADTEGKRTQGLGNREGLCSTCGMLFLFEGPGRYAFWMKDMHFPLDIIWLLGDRVVAIERGVQPDYPGVFHPDAFADRVLELPASAGQSLNVGDVVRFNYE